MQSKHESQRAGTAIIQIFIYQNWQTSIFAARDGKPGMPRAQVTELLRVRLLLATRDTSCSKALWSGLRIVPLTLLAPVVGNILVPVVAHA
jgi:hypothetical protein